MASRAVRLAAQRRDAADRKRAKELTYIAMKSAVNNGDLTPAEKERELANLFTHAIYQGRRMENERLRARARKEAVRG